MVIAYLQGYQGEAWVNKMPEPDFGFIISGEYSFFGGNSKCAEAEVAVKNIFEYINGGETTAIYSPHHLEWRDLILECFPQNASEVIRYWIVQNDYDFDTEKLKAFADNTTAARFILELYFQGKRKQFIYRAADPSTVAEIGYWIGVPFWGKGLIPEACEELIRHAFEDLKLENLWCGYFDGNEKSKRAQAKCHFAYHHTAKDVYWALMDDIRTEHITCLTKESWDARKEKRKMKKETKNPNMAFFDKYAKLMAEGFKDDPGILIQFQGVEHNRELFELNCKCQIETFYELGCLTTYGDGKGMAIGYFSNDITAAEIMQKSQEKAHYLLESPFAHELSEIQSNVAKVAEIAKHDWYMQYTKDDNVYDLQVIVVQQSQRGTGVFRKLITPILNAAEKRNVPVVLQTNEHKNIAIYEHFGFELMEKVTSDKVNLSCYNMMKSWER